jgi:TRAP transporter 4TM/12TM fusion protein
MVAKKTLPEGEERQDTRRQLEGWMSKIVVIIAIACSVFELLSLTILTGDPWAMEAALLAFIFPLGFLMYGPSKEKMHRKRVPIEGIVLSLLGISTCVYIIPNILALDLRLLTWPTKVDIAMGAISTILVLELTRRIYGPILPSFAIAFILYGYFGKYIPGVLGHPGNSVTKIISFCYSTNGVYGVAVYVTWAYIYIYMLFGSFLLVTGAGQFLIDVANSLSGWARGGPAKVAVIASGLFGTLSGSGVANVVTTGQFTIPMMKKTGYKPHFAGAVEAVASTGGSLMPPVMGTGAFLMAEILGIPYWEIVKAAILPAILYYSCIFFQVDLEAVKAKLKGMARADLPNLRNVFMDVGYLVIPIVVLVYELGVVQASISRSAIISIVVLLIVSTLKRKTRITLSKFVKAMSGAGIEAVGVALGCACIGIVIGIIGMTGLGIKITSLIVNLAGGNLFLTLVFASITAIILGMGMPTLPAYIVAAAIAAPAAIKLGVPPLAAHLFVFYYSIISGVTPPVAMCAYAAAAIAGSDPLKTALAGSRLAIVAYVVPFLFVYYAALLMRGSTVEILWAFITATIGCACLAMSIEGYFYTGNIKWNPAQRILFLPSSFFLMTPGLRTDIIGFALFLSVFFSHRECREYIKSALNKVKATRIKSILN